MATADENRFGGFLAEFDPAIAALGQAAVDVLRAMLPSADVMIYDNYNFLVAGFSPNNRPSDAVLSIALSARNVALCFLRGAELPDPNGILRGSGKVVRNVRLAAAEDLNRGPIAALLKAAISNSRVPFDPTRAGRLYVRSVSGERRSRRV